MWYKILLGTIGILVAFGILFVSLFSAASVKYNLEDSSYSFQVRQLGKTSEIRVNYSLPHPGPVLPDSILWPLKALRDRVWIFMTTNPTRKAELLLLFADKRLGMVKILFERRNFGAGISTLTKAEKYLEQATWLEKENRNKGINTIDFLNTLALASLKHYEVMEELKVVAPEETKPEIIRMQEYAKRTFECARNGLLEKGSTPPENPFDW